MSIDTEDGGGRFTVYNMREDEKPRKVQGQR